LENLARPGGNRADVPAVAHDGRGGRWCGRPASSQRPKCPRALDVLQQTGLGEVTPRGGPAVDGEGTSALPAPTTRAPGSGAPGNWRTRNRGPSPARPAARRRTGPGDPDCESRLLGVSRRSQSAAPRAADQGQRSDRFPTVARRWCPAPSTAAGADHGRATRRWRRTCGTSAARWTPATAPLPRGAHSRRASSDR
jgi:hypothetical protein